VLRLPLELAALVEVGLHLILCVVLLLQQVAQVATLLLMALPVAAALVHFMEMAGKVEMLTHQALFLAAVVELEVVAVM
jgi:hypothetical protein